MSMIPASISAQASTVLGPMGKGVFSKLSPSDNIILNRQHDQEDLQFPQELGENEYNQFILFTSYETKGEKTSAKRRQAQRDEVTLGEELEVARPESVKLVGEANDAILFNEILQGEFAQPSPSNFVELPNPGSRPGGDPFVAANDPDVGNPALAYYTQDGFDAIELAANEAKAEVERLSTRRTEATRIISESNRIAGSTSDITERSSIFDKPLTDARRSHESFISDRSRTTIEQQKLLGIERRTTSEGRLRLTSATEKSNSNIALYLPNKLVNSGSIGYNNLSFELIQAGMSVFQSDTLVEAATKLGGLGRRKLAGVVDDIASIAGIPLNAEAAATQITGLAINPRMQQSFQGVNLRGFDFTFSFAPKNQKEAIQVSKIIRAFRKKAHPSIAKGGIFLNIPDEFEIRYYKVFNNGVVAENLFLNKIGRCALTAINVDYTPNGINATFPDGSPVRTSLTMQFTELRPLVREDIEEGY